VTARDAGNVNLAPGIPVHFTTSDPSVATASRLGTVTAQDPKRQVMVYATTMVYGVIKTDSVEVSTDYPLSVIVAAERKITSTDTLLVFHPHRIYIRAGGHVAFFNVTIGGIFNTQPLDVVFSDPSAAHSGPIIYPPGEGNIAPFVGTDWTDWARARTFVTPGTYTFRSNRYGTTGTIVVQ
jgi:plastocyanin